MLLTCGPSGGMICFYVSICIELSFVFIKQDIPTVAQLVERRTVEAQLK